MLNYYPKLSTLSSQQRAELDQQQAEERKREMCELREQRRREEERETRKRLREMEARLKSDRKPGLPKKQRPETDNHTTINSTGGNVNLINQSGGNIHVVINNIANTEAAQSPNSSSSSSQPPLSSSPSSSPSSSSSSPSSSSSSTSSSSSSSSSLTAAAWMGLVPCGNVKGPSVKRGSYIDWVADYNLFEQIVSAVKTTSGFSEAWKKLQGTRLQYILYKVFKKRREDDLPVNSIIGQSIMQTIIAQYEPKALPSLIVDKRLPTLKPLIVEWAFDSWNELNKRTEMLLKGWSKPGLDKIFDVERQDLAMTNLVVAGIKLGEYDDAVEEDGESGADQCEDEDEEEELDDEKDDDGVHEDEEEIKIDEIMIATINEERPKGTRRSTRVQYPLQMRQDEAIAKALQRAELRGI